MKERISPASFDLIVRFEVGGGRKYFEKFLARPTWPGGASGVTIGIGYDLGYESIFMVDWSSFLSADQLARLSRCLGKTGSRAKQALSGVRDIVIAWEDALEVFNERTLPQEIRNTLKTFPGADTKLPANAFGSLVSLVFNRGTEIDDSDRRKEMREIRSIIKSPLPQRDMCRAIAMELRRMKRLWHDNPESDGDLVDRREAEAKLIEQAT